MLVRMIGPSAVRTETLMITHLSYPRNCSVNSFIPKRFAKVKYARFDQAVKLCLKHGKGCYLSKADLKSAFRQLPVRPQDIHLLGIRDQQGNYYVDVRIPFGLSSAPLTFEKVSQLLQKQ